MSLRPAAELLVCPLDVGQECFVGEDGIPDNIFPEIKGCIDNGFHCIVRRDAKVTNVCRSTNFGTSASTCAGSWSVQSDRFAIRVEHTLEGPIFFVARKL